MDFNWTLAGVAIAIFFTGYYIGWFARGKWEEKKHLVAAFGKDLKKKVEEKKKKKK
jgi:hypothetical protein